MRQRSGTHYLPWLRVVLGVLVLQLGIAQGAVGQEASPEQATVDELNQIRAEVGLDPVSLDEGGAASLHAHYLALNPDADAFREDPTLPGYTPEGAAIANLSLISPSGVCHYGPSGRILCAPQGPVDRIHSMIDKPPYRQWLLSPGLTQVSIGEEGDIVVFEGDRVWSGPPVVVKYPPDGASSVPTEFAGTLIGVSADPYTGDPVGYPVSLDMWGCDAKDVGTDMQATLSVGTTSVASIKAQLWADRGLGGGRQVLLVAQNPLSDGSTYTASIEATCGALGRATYTWSFTTQGPVGPSTLPGTQGRDLATPPAAVTASSTPSPTLATVATSPLAVVGAFLSNRAPHGCDPISPVCLGMPTGTVEVTVIFRDGGSVDEALAKVKQACTTQATAQAREECGVEASFNAEEQFHSTFCEERIPEGSDPARPFAAFRPLSTVIADSGSVVECGSGEFDKSTGKWALRFGIAPEDQDEGFTLKLPGQPPTRLPKLQRVFVP